jgi:chain length determinant protein EpsF
MPLDQLWVALKARWPTAAITAGLVVLAALALSLALPRYDATATLVVQMNSADPIAGLPAYKPAGEVSTYLATQADIIRSEAVALRALRALGLNKHPEWLELWRKASDGQGELEPWLAEQLLRKLDVRPARASNVITVLYTSADPVFSAAVVNAFVDAYLQTTLQLRAAPAGQFKAFFEERAKPIRAALDKARARLSAYEQEHGITVGDDPDVEVARLAELTSQLVSLQDAAAEAANRRKQALAAPADMREVRNDPEVAVLTAELVRLESQLADLNSEFGEQHPAVIQARGSIRDARRRLDGAMRRAAESLVAPSKVIEARLAEVRSAIAKQRELVLKRKSQRDAAAALRRDVDNAEKVYSDVLARASQTALESANTTPTSVSVLKTATPPLWSPGKLIRNLLVAALVGMLLGVWAALLAERRDRRLRTVADVIERLRQPLLLVLPDGEARSRRRAEQTQRRLVSGRPPLLGLR